MADVLHALSVFTATMGEKDSTDEVMASRIGSLIEKCSKAVRQQEK